MHALGTHSGPRPSPSLSLASFPAISPQRSHPRYVGPPVLPSSFLSSQFSLPLGWPAVQASDLPIRALSGHTI